LCIRVVGERILKAMFQGPGLCPEHGAANQHRND
jgi:hypothetical protein